MHAKLLLRVLDVVAMGGGVGLDGVERDQRGVGFCGAGKRLAPSLGRRRYNYEEIGALTIHGKAHADFH